MAKDGKKDKVEFEPDAWVRARRSIGRKNKS
jgi:hypothetical protein